MQCKAAILGLACLGWLGVATAVRADEAELHNERGRAWSDQREYDKAIAEFTLAIQLDPNFASAYNNRGLALAWKGKKEFFDRALADFDRAIQLAAR